MSKETPKITVPEHWKKGFTKEDLAKLNLAITRSTFSLNSTIARTLAQISLISFPNIARLFSGLHPLLNIISSIDWQKFEKSYRLSMIASLNSVKDARITSILGQVLAEYWLDVFVKMLFQNSKEIQELSYDTKRKILFGLRIIDSNLNNDLKRLDDIRGEYGHNFVVDEKKILKLLEKINCYKKMKFGKNSKLNNRIKKCSIQIVSDLMDIESKFIIEIKKIKKPTEKNA